MNALISDLQSEAWARGVKLVADVSAPITATFDLDRIRQHLASYVSILLSQAEAGASFSVVTALEHNEEGARPGFLKIEIAAPYVDSPAAQKAADALVNAMARHQLHAEIILTPRDRTCRIYVPAADSQERAVSLTRTAVVVDDDIDMQDFLTAVLSSQGFQVIAVNDGFDALVVIERHQPDVVLTDVLMPNMNGIDLVERIKNYRQDLPVIVFSGYCGALLQNFSGLPDRILQKPMSRDDIISALDEVLSKVPTP